jgi:thymidylate synthase ThyX
VKVELLSITPNAEELIERAGRICYNSEMNPDTRKQFIKKLVERGHESPIEHGVASFQIEGVSRALTHQLVRHRLTSCCLAGDTVIPRYAFGRKRFTIKELYERQCDPQLRGRNKLMNIRSMNENKIIIPNKIKDVMYSGKKEVFEITTRLGYKIKASKDHIFFNSDGEVQLKNLQVGSNVFVNGIELYKDKEWFSEKYNSGLNTTQIAELCGIASCTARKWMRIHKIKAITKYKGSVAWNKGLKGELSHSYGKKLSEETKRKLSLVRAGCEMKPIEELTEKGKRLRFTKIKKEKCQLCGTLKNLENHHIDKDINNYHAENCLTVCSQCHHLLHQGYVVKKVILDTIVSIESKGVMDTYDIEMEHPYHNFVASGFIVHNSQESQRYVKIIPLTSVIPPEIENNPEALKVYLETMNTIEGSYKKLLSLGILKEDARFITPQATCTKFMLTANFREWRHIIQVRTEKSSQWEIRNMINEIKNILIEACPSVFEDLEDKEEVDEY